MQKGRTSRIALIVVIAVGLAACVSLIEGESVSREAGTLPETERAVMLGRSAWYLIFAFDYSIWSMDGVIGSGAGERLWEVAPGRHTVEVDMWEMVGGMDGTVRYEFELEMQASHRYQIHGVRDERRCVIMIDEWTSNREERSALEVPCVERGGKSAKSASAGDLKKSMR